MPSTSGEWVSVKIQLKKLVTFRSLPNYCYRCVISGKQLLSTQKINYKFNLSLITLATSFEVYCSILMPYFICFINCWSIASH